MKSLVIVKKRKRFVMGIKQCMTIIIIIIIIIMVIIIIIAVVILGTTMVKTGRALLVVLAPNTETAQVIDDKIETIIQHCHDKEIPILYALNKRKLGKAIQASIKQSVVAVSQPDGCYDIFKKTIKFSESSFNQQK